MTREPRHDGRDIRNDDEDHDICYKQPETPEEAELCEKALDLCPVQAQNLDTGPTLSQRVRIQTDRSCPFQAYCLLF